MILFYKLAFPKTSLYPSSATPPSTPPPPVPPPVFANTNDTKNKTDKMIFFNRFTATPLLILHQPLFLIAFSLFLVKTPFSFATY